MSQAKKSINLFGNIIKSNFNVLKFPYKLSFAVTYHCNSKCIQCSIWKKKPKKELSLDEIREFTKKSNIFYWYNLTGGEPFLRRDIVDIVKILIENSKNFYLLNITTNSFNPPLIYKRIEEIISLRPPNFIVIVSLDGDKETHEYIRRIPGSFDNAVSLFKMLRNLSKENKNFKTFLGYTVSPWNIGKIKKMFDSVKFFIPDIKPHEFHFNIFHYSSHYYSNFNSKFPYTKERWKREVLSELETIESFKSYKITSAINLIEKIYLKLAKDFIKKDKTPIPCKVLQSSLFLDPLGNVFPCIIYDKKLGNIREVNYDIKKILKKKEVKKLRREIIRLKCPNCWTPCEAYQTILGNIIRGSII
ncbi:MAG: radical SAM protein [Candidatus Micrarchaeia archaeon]